MKVERVHAKLAVLERRMDHLEDRISNTSQRGPKHFDKAELRALEVATGALKNHERAELLREKAYALMLMMDAKEEEITKWGSDFVDAVDDVHEALEGWE